MSEIRLGTPPEKPASQPTATEPDIEGGFVDEIREPPFDEPKHRAVTAQRLAMLFAYILAGALLVHYICFMVLAFRGQDKSIDSLEHVYIVWLPALIGIVSSAATYYFTKDR
jgi:hypothetical protein